MTMIMMANQAEPLDSSCTKTKYMSWVCRKGLVEETQWLVICNAQHIYMLPISYGKLKKPSETQRFRWGASLTRFVLFTVNSGLTGRVVLLKMFYYLMTPEFNIPCRCQTTNISYGPILSGWLPHV